MVSAGSLPTKGRRRGAEQPELDCCVLSQGLKAQMLLECKPDLRSGKGLTQD